MCTVVYFPKKHKPSFASLRDESPQRPMAIAPALSKLMDTRYLMPKDALAGGTWLGVNEYKNVIILLNGGFENHQRKASYAKSRGQIVAELLASLLPVVDWQLMDLMDIEPFTLVVWSENNLFELVWDGQEKHRNIMDATVPHIWSSSTLYTQEAKNKRKELFENWMALDVPVSKQSLLNFFNSIVNSENGFIMNRNEIVKTLSYSFIELKSDELAQFDYFDFQDNQHHISSIEFIQNSNECILEQFKRQ